MMEIAIFLEVTVPHSMENMVAEVALHNDIEMSKNCPKIAKNGKKVQKLPKNCPKLKGYLMNYIFHTVH